MKRFKLSPEAAQDIREIWAILQPTVSKPPAAFASRFLMHARGLPATQELGTADRTSQTSPCFSGRQARI